MIAVVTLPITALASVLGMNLIVNDHTTPVPLAIALAVMLTMSSLLRGGPSARAGGDGQGKSRCPSSFTPHDLFPRADVARTVGTNCPRDIRSWEESCGVKLLGQRLFP